MARNSFAEQDDVEVVEDTIVVNDDLVTARVKGTWEFTYGSQVYNFVDGQRYRLPRETFNYLRSFGNIYDTL